MCDPATAMMAGGFAMNAGSQVMAHQGQVAQAESQNAWNRQRQELGTERALENYANQIMQARARQSQEREAAANEINEVNREARKRVSTAQVAAGESGVTGGSLQALLNDFHRQQLEFGTSVRRNLEFREDNIEDQLESVRLGTQGRIEGLMFMPQQKPSFMGAALRIAGSGLSTFGNYASTTGMFGPDPGAGTGVGAFGDSGIPWREGTYGAGGMGPDYLR